jgi:hypothetical protein
MYCDCSVKRHFFNKQPCMTAQISWSNPCKPSFTAMQESILFGCFQFGKTEGCSQIWTPFLHYLPLIQPWQARACKWGQWCKTGVQMSDFIIIKVHNKNFSQTLVNQVINIPLKFNHIKNSKMDCFKDSRKNLSRLK